MEKREKFISVALILILALASLFLFSSRPHVRYYEGELGFYKAGVKETVEQGGRTNFFVVLKPLSQKAPIASTIEGVSSGDWGEGFELIKISNPPRQSSSITDDPLILKANELLMAARAEARKGKYPIIRLSRPPH